MASSVVYLGYLIDATGLHSLPEGNPGSTDTDRNWLANLLFSIFTQPVYSTRPTLQTIELSGNGLTNSQRHSKAFNKSKELLMSSQQLIHFDPKLPITLTCDVSNYGIGTVLSHILPDGSEKPVAYASRTLISAEKNYSQIEKEGLACVFGVKKFYNYLFGHKFDLITDHNHY